MRDSDHPTSEEEEMSSDHGGPLDVIIERGEGDKWLHFTEQIMVIVTFCFVVMPCTLFIPQTLCCSCSVLLRSGYPLAL